MSHIHQNLSYTFLRLYLEFDHISKFLGIVINAIYDHVESRMSLNHFPMEINEAQKNWRSGRT